MTETLITAQEAARFLSLSVSTIRAWTSQRRIPFIKLNGKAVRYRREDLERMISAGEHPLRDLAWSQEGQR